MRGKQPLDEDIFDSYGDDEEESDDEEKEPAMCFEDEFRQRKQQEGHLPPLDLHIRGKKCQTERNMQSAIIYFKLGAEKEHVDSLVSLGYA